MKNKNKQILLTWDAFNNGFVVTAKATKLLLEKNDIQINEIVYLQSQNLQKINLAEIDLFLNKKKISEIWTTTPKEEKERIGEERLKKRFRDCKDFGELFINETGTLPKFKNKRINIKNVTHYQSIFDKLVEFIKENFYDKSNFNLHINVSPGTPQMHVVWLMLNASGYLPDNTTLWSSQWDKLKKVTTLEKISFKPKTFLSESLNKKYLNTLPKINPNETKSLLRKEAEEYLDLFSKVPNASLLLLGERGTGKSTYVRNFLSNNNSYNELACGVFSEDLMRSELFGYKKGSFTGANMDKEGILAKFSKGGVLFLDEIHDLSKPLQRQLIQVLQTGEYYPIGSDKPEKSNFRLITASNLNLDKLSKKLDADFLDRIARFIVEIPPLRNCKEDLEMYWKEVWKQISNFENSPPLIWNVTLNKYLKSNLLSGNFRDLQKITSFIMAFYIKYHDKDKAIKKAIQEFEKWNKKKNNELNFFKIDKTYDYIIAHFNKELVEWAIKQYGSKKEAAKILKRSESSINKDLKMERLKINKQQP